MIAVAASYEYATVERYFWRRQKKKAELPSFCCWIILRTLIIWGSDYPAANLAGAHGVIIPKRRAAGLTAVVARTSAGALNYTPVASSDEFENSDEQLKKEGMWFVCVIWAVLPIMIWI